MQIRDIIKDSIFYPTRNIKSSWIFMILAIFVGIIAVIPFNLEIAQGNMGTAIKVGLMLSVFVFSVLLFLLTQGYSLDILRESILRSDETPNFDLSRQLSNSSKILLVNVIYFIIPSILSFFLGVILQLWIVPILGVIISAVFFLATTMAECRLAKTGNLTNALNVVGTIRDISAIGFEKVFLTLLTIILVTILSLLIVLGISWYFASNILTSVMVSIFGVYMLFFSKRAMGLLYSEM